MRHANGLYVAAFAATSAIFTTTAEVAAVRSE